MEIVMFVKLSLPIAGLAGLAATAAIAQEQVAPVATDTAIPTLMFGTIGGVLLVAILALAYFFRKKSNREATERVLDPTHPSNK
ncbi:MAG: hypothetical protein CTY31_12885 [Hyphomicrobium sp.]|nr:MAG: hypothetical protein CTY39_10475 [Hyphomicrobium sp.]PPC98642.1 MAG: hypothetical protein CTY31_12885 [Hyphomicrobium sp.]